MRFTNPAFLLLLVPLAIGLYASYRHVHGMAKARKRLAFAIRGLMAGLLIFALSGPEARRQNRGLATIFLLDRSDSITETDRAAEEKFVDGALRALGPDDVGGVVAFGGDAAVDAATTGRRDLGRVLSKVDGGSTDLAGAIRLASASFPEGKARRIVVLSDGNETRGDATGAAQVAATDGIGIDYVPLRGREATAEAAVVSLEAPDETRVEQPFDLRGTIESTVAQSGTIDVDRDGVLLKQVPVRLEKGENRIVISDKLAASGLHRYRATLRVGRDGDNRNNVGTAFTAVKGRPRILVAQSHPERTELATALKRRGWEVDLRGPGGVPSRPEEFAAYDAVVFNDFNASNLTDRQMKLTQSAIRDAGVGFAMVGGEDSFLPGGWYGTPVAEALPVDLNIRQRKSFPSTSVAIMVDASGSMGMIEDGFPKIRLAAQAAEQTVKLLSPMDRVAVAGSSDGIEFVVPMQKLNDKGAVAGQLRKLDINGGGIYIRPTMDKAEQVLNAETTKVRHHILLADGNDSEDQDGALGVALRMHENKITTSVVAIGDGKDVAFLKQLAAAGGGRFYLAKRAGQLPAIFTQDTAIMSRSAIEEGAFLPRLVAGEEILRGIDATPPLLAYCLTDRRPLARTSMLTKKDDPLLASWQYGLGASLAFTSDATARWAKNWVGWPGYDAFWSQAARAIGRRATQNRYQATIRQESGKGVVELNATDTLGNPVTNNEAAVRVATPSGGSREVTLTQSAPGRFQGSFDAEEIGSYLVTVAEPDRKGGMLTRTTAFGLPYPAEYRTVRPNRPLLARLSETTGGKGLTKPEEALRPAQDPGASITELWPMLLMASALLLPLDVAVRRVALPLGEIFARLSARMRRRPAEAPVETVGRLQKAKARAHTTTPVAKVELPSAEPRTQEPKEAPKVAAGEARSPAASLLEAKRKRRGE
jgi:uncharacterized membrane protein